MDVAAIQLSELRKLSSVKTHLVRRAQLLNLPLLQTESDIYTTFTHLNYFIYTFKLYFLPVDVPRGSTNVL